MGQSNKRQWKECHHRIGQASYQSLCLGRSLTPSYIDSKHAFSKLGVAEITRNPRKLSGNPFVFKGNCVLSLGEM